MANDYDKNKCRLITMFTMTFGYFLVEIIVGYICNSEALIADSFHMLSDVAALVVAFLSVKMSPRKWSRNTFGWARAEVLGALVNAVFLIALCFSILVDSIKRFVNGGEKIEKALMLLIVGGVGLLVNILGLCLFSHGHSHAHSHLKHQSRLTRMVSIDETKNEEGNEEEVIDENTTYSSKEVKVSIEGGKSERGSEKTVSSIRELPAPKDPPQPPTPPQPPPTVPAVEAPAHTHSHSHLDEDGGSGANHMNIRGVFLHLMADALGSIVVIISALATYFFGDNKKYEKYINYVDPSLSVFIVLIILISTWPLLQESALILLQTVPTHIQVDTLRRRLLQEVEGVIAVHEFHIWQLAGNRIVASAHIRCRNLVDYMRIAEGVKEFFHNQGIHSTTIQPEFMTNPDDVSSTDCALACPTTGPVNCAPQSCCAPDGK